MTKTRVASALGKRGVHHLYVIYLLKKKKRRKTITFRKLILSTRVYNEVFFFGALFRYGRSAKTEEKEKLPTTKGSWDFHFETLLNEGRLEGAAVHSSIYSTQKKTWKHFPTPNLPPLHRHQQPHLVTHPSLLHHCIRWIKGEREGRQPMQWNNSDALVAFSKLCYPTDWFLMVPWNKRGGKM